MNERAIFEAAVDISDPAERAAFLDQSCGDDADMCRRLDELLAAQEKLGSFLAQPLASGRTVDFAPISEKPGSMIGPYKLKEQIGEGGFGLVFVAEQQEPVKRKVALKVIKPGMDTREVMARFTAERQALALMDHPNIARVLDAGATDSGRPYFVMELVRGIPITEYCDQNQLAPRDRLDLFVTVCQAVQHAHQKGIIHRDIKPSNVLVTSHDGKPVAKVIDFGVAKAINQQLTERSIYTNFAQMVGTPLYMSPEQAEMSGLDIDTRSDIYSLGVLLYELLTGTTPLDKKRFAQAAYDEIRRMIREDEPPKPSTRLSTSDSIASIAAQRHIEPARLSKLLRGDLDWITMKALEKDRTRRYETASGLARDIQRYLSDEPVEACPPSAGYRLRKFAKKNQAALTTAVAILLLLLTGVTASTWQAIRATAAERVAKAESVRATAAEEQARGNEAKARDNEQQAERRAAESQALIAFINTLLREADTAIWDKSQTRDRSFLEVLEAAEPNIEAGLEDHPLAEAQLRELLGRLYSDRIDERAIPQLRRALEIRQELGPDDDQTFNLKEALADALEDLGKWDDALALREECINDQRRIHGPLSANTFHSRIRLGRLCFAAKQPDRGRAALDAVERDFGVLKARGGTLEVALLERLLDLGRAYLRLHERDKALHWYHEAGRAFGTDDERFAADAVAAVDFISYVANEYADAEQSAEALTWFERYAHALHEEQKSDGQEDWRMNLRGSSVRSFHASAMLTEAAPLGTWLDCNVLIELCRKPEELDRIAAMLSRHVLHVRQKWPDERQGLAKALAQLGRCRLKQGRYAEAESPLRESLAIRQQENPDSLNIAYQNSDELGGGPGKLTFHGFSAWITHQNSYELGGSLLGQKKYAEAEPHLLAGFTGLKERGDQMSMKARANQLGQAAEWLAELYTALDKPELAATWRAEQAEQQLRLRAARALSMVQSGDHTQPGRIAEAVAELTEATRTPTANAPGSPKWIDRELYNFACVYAVASGQIADKQQEYADRAMELLHQAVQAGWKHSAHMRTDADLFPLRERADFKKLLAELSGPLE